MYIDISIIMKYHEIPDIEIDASRQQYTFLKIFTKIK